MYHWNYRPIIREFVVTPTTALPFAGSPHPSNPAAVPLPHIPERRIEALLANGKLQILYGDSIAVADVEAFATIKHRTITVGTTLVGGKPLLIRNVVTAGLDHDPSLKRVVSIGTLLGGLNDGEPPLSFRGKRDGALSYVAPAGSVGLSSMISSEVISRGGPEMWSIAVRNQGNRPEWVLCSIPEQGICEQVALPIAISGVDSIKVELTADRAVSTGSNTEFSFALSCSGEAFTLTARRKNHLLKVFPAAQSSFGELRWKFTADCARDPLKWSVSSHGTEEHPERAKFKLKRPG